MAGRIAVHHKWVWMHPCAKMCGAWMTPFFGFSLLLLEVYKTRYCTSFGTIMYPEYISLSKENVSIISCHNNSTAYILLEQHLRLASVYRPITFLMETTNMFYFWGLQTLKYLQYDFFSSAAHAVSNVLPEQMSFRPMTVPGAWNDETWNTQAILECRKGMSCRWPIMTRSVQGI